MKLARTVMVSGLALLAASSSYAFPVSAEIKVGCEWTDSSGLPQKNTIDLSYDIQSKRNPSTIISVFKRKLIEFDLFEGEEGKLGFGYTLGVSSAADGINGMRIISDGNFDFAKMTVNQKFQVRFNKKKIVACTVVDLHSKW